MDKDREAFLKWKASRSCALPNPTDFDAWVAATAAERERCAKVCEAEHVGSSLEAPDLVPEDFAYNMALQHAAAAIRGA